MEDKNQAMARRVAEAAAQVGGRAYYVGGYVRDRLRGMESKDVDIEVHGVPTQALEAILDGLGTRLEMGASFGIYGLKHYDLDIALPRREQAIGRGHRDFQVFTDPYLGTEKAAMRRDFTINTMMEDVLTGEILDPFGGQEDLRRGIVRHVNDSSFGEDPLRVLRAAQFAARFRFTVAEETVALCRSMDVAALARERVMGELEKALLKGENPAVLSGRPSMGKTAVALHMALQAARAGRNTLYFSIEMSEEEVTERILSMLSGVEAGKIRFKGTNREERALLEKAAAELAGLPLRIVYCGSLAIDEIRAVLMTRKARRELDIFFIDYLNLIHIPYTRGSRNETTDLALGDVVRKVKLMAVELDVPAVLLAQMNRDSDRRLAPYLPILSDLRNSGAIEQVADQVIFVYRAEKYGILYDKDTKEDLRGVGYLLVAKNRNGATGRARFRYNVSMTRFLSYENRLL